MAAGDGIAPPSSPSKGEVLLLNDPAEENEKVRIQSAELRKRRQVTSDIPHSQLCTLYFKVVEPEVVATSPCRIKSPMPVCCGFSSLNAWV
jgi:hypothetical protein